MRYQPFHMSRIGAAHIRRELPCQDASASETYQDACIAIVADGHGSRRHFRSERGAALACLTALEEIRAFLDGGPPAEDAMDEALRDLKQAICAGWTAAVLEDLENEPWTQEELAEQEALLTEEQLRALTEGTDAVIAYGSTLCAAFAFEGGWAAIQLGDGSFVHMSQDGTYEWPMPSSAVNEGNWTASLCMRDPIRDFRHCRGTDHPVGLLVYTDGIEKTFPPQGKEVTSLLHWIWRNQWKSAPEREENLARTLDTLTRRSPNGDDMSVAGMVDPEAEDVTPVPSMNQRRQELERLKAQIAEIENTIYYNTQRLRRARQNVNDVRSGAVEQLEGVIERKRQAAADLREQAADLCAMLGETMPPSGLEPEPEPALYPEQEETEAYPAEPEDAPARAAQPVQERPPRGGPPPGQAPERQPAPGEAIPGEDIFQDGLPRDDFFKDTLEAVQRFLRRM